MAAELGQVPIGRSLLAQERIGLTEGRTAALGSIGPLRSGESLWLADDAMPHFPWRLLIVNWTIPPLGLEAYIQIGF